MAREKPMTTTELFNKICEILRDKGKMPDILDYMLADTYEAVDITNYVFSIKNNLDYGGNEGIYLDIWIDYWDSRQGKRQSGSLGTFKTLRADDEAMHIMAVLLADFIIEESRYVNEHLDDFTWQGVNVYPLDETGQKMNWSYGYGTAEEAEKRMDVILSHYPKVIIRDNATRTEKTYYRGGETDNG